MSERELENQDTKSRLSLLLKIQVVIAVVAIIVTVVAALQVGPLIERKAQLESEIQAIESELSGKKDELAQLDKKIEQLKPLAKKGLGFKYESRASSSQIPETSLEAVDETKNIVSRGRSDRRNAVTVVIYRKNLEKELNADIVIPSLQELGFKIEQRSSALQSVSTNAIWYGANVNVDDVKLVAYQLIGAGLDIQTIKPFKNPQAKANRIEVGGDPRYLADEPLSVETIRQASEFER